MTKYITDNKYEFNVRRVEELNVAILAKETELENTVGFINRLKVRFALAKLYKKINTYGEENLRYEYANFATRAN